VHIDPGSNSMVTYILNGVSSTRSVSRQKHARVSSPPGKRRNRYLCRAAITSAPVPCNPNLPVPAPYPMAPIPNRVRMRSNHPAARTPDPSAAMPYPRASHPNVSRPWRHGDNFSRWRRRHYVWRRNFRSHFGLRSNFSLRRRRRRRSLIMHVNHAPLHTTRQQTNHRNRTKEKHSFLHICKRTVTWFDVRNQVLFILSEQISGCQFLPRKTLHSQRDIYPKGTGVVEHPIINEK
jgi:hypothetical protein